jgi:hypothetical protein
MADRKYIINSGDRFGRLIVIDEVYIIKKGYKQRYVNCLCDCGNKTIPRVTSIFDGNTSSCGCEKVKNVSIRRFKHGMCKTSLYYVFTDMKNRCYRKELPDYKNWGGRGIKICDEWMSDFLLFHNWAMSNGYEKGLTIERKNNNEGYSPYNCTFVTRLVQCNNKSNNHIIEYKDEKLTMMQFCRKYNINYMLFESRTRKGKSIEQAMVNCGKYKFKDQRRSVLV